jgi:hypothetical protein
VLARDHAVEAARQRHDARHRLVRGLQHLVVVAVDRDVGVHVAVAGVHVQRDPDAAAQHLLWMRRHSSTIGAKAAPANSCCSGCRICVFHEARRRGPAAARRSCAAVRPAPRRVRQPAAPQRAHLAQQRERLLHAVFEQLGARDVAGVVALAQRQRAAAKKASSASTSASLLRSDSSMLMRSMPSVYSPMRAAGSPRPR